MSARAAFVRSRQDKMAILRCSLCAISLPITIGTMRWIPRETLQSAGKNTAALIIISLSGDADILSEASRTPPHRHHYCVTRCNSARLHGAKEPNALARRRCYRQPSHRPRNRELAGRCTISTATVIISRGCLSAASSAFRDDDAGAIAKMIAFQRQPRRCRHLRRYSADSASSRSMEACHTVLRI